MRKGRSNHHRKRLSQAAPPPVSLVGRDFFLVTTANRLTGSKPERFKGRAPEKRPSHNGPGSGPAVGGPGPSRPNIIETASGRVVPRARRDGPGQRGRIRSGGRSCPYSLSLSLSLSLSRARARTLSLAPSVALALALPSSLTLALSLLSLTFSEPAGRRRPSRPDRPDRDGRCQSCESRESRGANFAESRRIARRSIKTRIANRQKIWPDTFGAAGMESIQCTSVIE